MLRTYEPGSVNETSYFGGIVRPYVGLGYWAPNRVWDYAQVNVPSWADGGDPSTPARSTRGPDPRTVQQLTEVYIDGELVKPSEYQGANICGPARRRQELARRQHRRARRHVARLVDVDHDRVDVHARPARPTTGRTGCCR